MKTLWQKFLKRLQGSSFIKSVLTLSSGIVIGQLINFLASPFLGRIYDPAAFGNYALLTSTAATIQACSCLGMMTVFMLPEEDEESRALCRFVLKSVALLSALIIAVFWFLRPHYKITDFSDYEYGQFLLTMYIYIVLLTANNVSYAYSNRMKQYKRMFWNPIIGAGVKSSCSILFGLWGWGYIGYTLGSVLSYLANIVHLSRADNAYASVNKTKYSTSFLLKVYKRFPVYQMPANLLSALTPQLHAQIIDSVFSASALGMYSMAIRILSLPAAVLAGPVNQVYFREATERKNRGEDIGEFTFKILQTNIKLAIIPISILMILGEPIFSLFLGEKWREAGSYAALLGMLYLIKFCDACVSGGFVIINRNNINLYGALYSLLTTFLLYWYVSQHEISIFAFLLILSVIGILKSIVFEAIFLKMLGIKTAHYYKFILLYVICPCFLAWGVRWFFLN